MQINESFVVDSEQQYLLDSLLENEKRETCPDCGVSIGVVHDPRCGFSDTAIELMNNQDKLNFYFVND